MRSSAPKKQHAEVEFDDLLGQLVDELAMTPPSQSAVGLVPEPAPQVRMVSTGEMAAEAAAAAAANAAASQRKPDNTLVKVVGIIAGSLTAVAIAAMVVFSGGETTEQPEAPVTPEAAVAQEADEAARKAAEEHARQQALATAQAQAQAEAEAERARAEAARLAAEAAAAKAPEPTSEAKPKPRNRNKPKPKPKPGNPGGDFDEL